MSRKMFPKVKTLKVFVNLVKTRFHKIYTPVAIYENLVKKIKTNIYSNTRFLISTKRLAFIFTLSSER